MESLKSVSPLRNEYNVIYTTVNEVNSKIRIHNFATVLKTYLFFLGTISAGFLYAWANPALLLTAPALLIALPLGLLAGYAIKSYLDITLEKSKAKLLTDISNILEEKLSSVDSKMKEACGLSDIKIKLGCFPYTVQKISINPFEIVEKADQPAKG